MRQIDFDAIVIGGGFYGCCLAITLASRLRRIALVERESDLLMRASYSNQARVHNGYHYPRSLLTAIRSAANYPTFTGDFRECIDRTFLHIYGVARSGSKVSAYQFRRFCAQVGIPLGQPPPSIAKLFNNSLVDEIFVVEECGFNAEYLRKTIAAKLASLGVEPLCNREAQKISRHGSGKLLVTLNGGDELGGNYVFNCTYSGINRLLGRSGLPLLPLKHEVAELALIEMPPILQNVGVTLMDGPFFSTIPFPPLNLHSLSHVSYTPHEAWGDGHGDFGPESILERTSKSVFMLKDAQRYLPALQEARYVRSLFEIKTVLLRNEVDDGRPILCASNHGIKGCFVVLGSKIDNIYDIIQTLEGEPFSTMLTHRQLEPAS